jgi:medium-chain acyl-[acyl-carrier-protein] hydrolase
MSGSTWLRRFAATADAPVRLLCFHYAGGSASMFRDWRLGDDIDIVAVQLPGRDIRLAEPPYRHMDPLVTDLVPVLAPLLDRPFACYGSSMGARVALATTHALRDGGLPAPARLFVASSAAPRLHRPVRGWQESEDGLVDYVRALGGTPEQVLASAELRALFLPTLRADLTVVGTCPDPGPPLSVPIRAFAGADDTEAPPSDMQPWRDETTADFDLYVLPGGHFFDQAGYRMLWDLIGKDLIGTDLAA